MREYALARLVLAGPTRSGEIYHGRMSIELEGDMRSGFTLDRNEFNTLAASSSDPMTFAQALLFLHRGRRVARRAWGESPPMGSLSVDNGQLRWQLASDMTVILPAEDLLAADWVVV